MENLVNQVGSIGQDNLIARLFPRALTTGVNIAAGAGELKRGTLLTLKDEGTYAVYSGASGTKQSAILVTDVDATGEEDAPAVVYVSGNFNPDALIMPDGYTLTAEDKDELRKYNIYFTQMFED